MRFGTEFASQLNPPLPPCRRHLAAAPAGPPRGGHSIAQQRFGHRASLAARVFAAAPASSPAGVDCDFDWQPGLTLAGCAFEAYNGLEEGGEEHVRQVSVGGTQVTYVDPRFVQSKLDGLIEVTVVSATGLKSSDVS